jgi:HSP20 family protein
MTNIIKRDNAGKTATFGTAVDQIFQRNLNDFFDDAFWGFNGFNTRNSVPVNIRQTERQFEIDVAAPGLKKSDFNVNISGDTLTISFGRKEEGFGLSGDSQERPEDKGWIRKEFSQGSFSRQFQLTETIETDKIAATYADGVLHLILPRKENAVKGSRQITIQ